jgi:hypothetical protein
MTQTFSYISIESFDVTYCVLEKNSDYLRFKIVAEDQNGALLDESNEITLTCVELENFYFSVIQGYYGTTLACRSKIVYDWYKVYLKGKLIAETEDPVLNLPYKLTKKQQQYLKIE